MRRVFALFCVLALGGCASLETRMREQRADRESIEASFASVEPGLRALAAESCAWSRTEDCEERLERMALEDPDDGVRGSAIRTLGRICGDAARRSLLRIAAVANGEEAIAEAAERCPAADLTLALEGAARSRSEGTPEERKAWLAWLEGVVAQPPPRDETRALRDRVARQLRRENAEAARALEISRAREKAWAALDAGELEEAAVQVAHLAALGAPSGDLLRRIAAMDLQRTRRAFDEALRDGDPDRAEGLLREVPALQLQDPTLAFRAQVARYDILLPSAAWVEDLARSGKVDEARAERRKLLERGGEAVLLDQARASRRRSEQLVEKGRFAAAWRESWSLRETESVAAERFMVRFGVERWRREGLEMTRAQLTSFVDDLGEHAPQQATNRLALFHLMDETAAGRSAAAMKALERIGEDLGTAVLRCDEADGALPPPADKFSLADMPAALEYMAQRVPTQKQRVSLRRTRDEGKALLRKVIDRREDLHALVEVAERCEGGAKELAWYEGAPPGSEAYAKSLVAAKKTRACLQDLMRRVDAFQHQAEACARYLEKASSALQEAFSR